MPPSKFQTILLAAKGDVKQAQITCAGAQPTADEIHAYMRKKEAPDAQVACRMKEQDVILWGYKKGKGTKNAHTLPIPNDFLGDILLVLKSGEQMKVKEWSSAAAAAATVSKQIAVRGEEEGELDVEAEVDEIEDEEEAEAEAEEEEEEEEEDADEEEPEEDVDGPILEDDEEEEAPVPKKKVSKKKPKLTTAFAKQQALLEDDTFEEITPENYEPNEVTLEVLRKYFSETKMPEEKIQDLESAIFMMAFNEAKRRHVISHWQNPLFKQLYKSILMRVISNLTPDSYVGNKSLYEKVVSGEIEIAHMADFSSYDLYPEHWKEMEDRRIMREQAYMEGNKGMATDQFKCSRCKKSQCTYYEMQTRSADEPMTLFITCVNCGKRWRQ